MASLVCVNNVDNVESEPVTSAPKRKRNGHCCAVAECKNKNANGFTLHQFPTEPERRKQWIKFVATRRVDFGPKFGTPTRHSRVCSDHFTPDSYEANVSLLRSFNMKAVPRLKATAVPTIHKPLSKTKSSTGTDSTVSRPTGTTPLSTYVTSSTVTTCVGSASVHEPRVSKLRGAYVKRQRKRIIDEALASADISDKLVSECSSYNPVRTELTRTADQTIQTSSGYHCQYMEMTRVLRLQKQHRVCKMSKKVQVTPVMAHKAVEDPASGLTVASSGVSMEEHNLGIKSKVKVETDIAEELLQSLCTEKQAVVVKVEVDEETGVTDEPLLSKFSMQELDQVIKTEVGKEIVTSEEPPQSLYMAETQSPVLKVEVKQEVDSSEEILQSWPTLENHPPALVSAVQNTASVQMGQTSEMQDVSSNHIYDKTQLQGADSSDTDPSTTAPNSTGISRLTSRASTTTMHDEPEASMSVALVHEDSDTRLTGRHFPEFMSTSRNASRKRKQLNCVVCYAKSRHRSVSAKDSKNKVKRTQIRCKTCKKALCVVPCFEIFHTQKYYA